MESRRLLFLSLAALAGLLLPIGGAQADGGALDPTFGKDGAAASPIEGYGYLFSVAVEVDGKIVVGGWIGPSETNASFALQRYNQDGSPDATFGEDGTVVTATPEGSSEIRTILLQPDGDILAVGTEYGAVEPDVTTFEVARYNSDGSLDGAFGNGGVAYGGQGSAAAATLQPDGKIVVGGDWGDVARFTADGSLDSSFGGDGEVDFVRADGAEGVGGLAATEDGRLLVAGRTQSSDQLGGEGADLLLARLNADGSLDSEFGSGGRVNLSNFAGYAIAPQPGAKFLLAGYCKDLTTGSGDLCFFRFSEKGEPDQSFGNHGVVRSAITGLSAPSMVVQPDGRILLAGNVWESCCFALLARYLPDGSPDPSFGEQGLVRTPAPESMDIPFGGIGLQADGKVVWVGTRWNVWTGGDRGFVRMRYLTDNSKLLKVKRHGTGSGTITSRPKGIACGGSCSAQFASESFVKLTAKPEDGADVSWSGACASNHRSCRVRMNAARSIVATFSRCVVPNIIGKNLTRAKVALRKARCSIGPVRRIASRAPKSRVVAQKPPAGRKLPARAKVTVVVSSGPARGD